MNKETPHMVDKHTCPRRVEQGLDRDDSPFRGSGKNLDAYDVADDTCTFCGSLNPDVLMARLEAGDVELGPTDKSYKVYVENRGGAVFKQHYRDCYSHKIDGKVTCTGPEDCTHWTTREIDTQKFYFQHLSVQQRHKFLELLNARRLHIGHPGHFYVMPFFLTYK